MEREPRHRLPSQAEKALDDLITSETLFALDASTALTDVFAGCTLSETQFHPGARETVMLEVSAGGGGGSCDVGGDD